MTRIITSLFCTLTLSLLCLSCLSSEEYEATNRGNFEALWQVLDEHYCFFDYKHQEYGLDWEEVRQRYEPQIKEDLPKGALYQILSKMTFELRDGHCSLATPSDVASYAQWYEAFPMNFSDSLQHKYLGNQGEYRITCGMRYRVLRDNIGYVRCPSFDTGMGDGNLHEIFDYLGPCDALIIDIRNNGGGKLTSASTLAGAFVNETRTLAYIRHKTGKAHNDFSEPQPMNVSPSMGLRWQKPVVVLTNRRSYSAANTFALFMHTLGIPLIGDKTGGGSGMPFNAELPEGWSIRFSACPMTDLNGNDVEFGIEPDHHVDITSEDYQRSIDTILEYALDYLAKNK